MLKLRFTGVSSNNHMFSKLVQIFAGRIKEVTNKKILDNATRKRRQKRQLEALEKDNFQDDPHAHLTAVPAKLKIPAFKDTMEGELLELVVCWTCDYLLRLQSTPS